MIWLFFYGDQLSDNHSLCVRSFLQAPNYRIINQTNKAVSPYHLFKRPYKNYLLITEKNIKAKTRLLYLEIAISILSDHFSTARFPFNNCQSITFEASKL